MQVKKFEAKTMKDALELVKIHLGPEAIILSAKDTHKGFGLMGEKSVEVTAAVSEETLRKKKLAESKLREDLRARYQSIPATKQKEFINRVYQNRMDEQREIAMVEAGGGPSSVQTRRAANPGGPPIAPEIRAQLKGLRYADIIDDQAQAEAHAHTRAYSQAQAYAQAQTEAPPEPMRGRGRERVRRAAEAARLASQDVLQEPRARVQRRSQAEHSAAPTVAPMQPQRSVEMASLESQLKELKAIVDRFQNMPQIPMSMHPGAEQGLPYELSGLYQRLTGQGLPTASVINMLKKAQKELDSETIKKPAMVDAWAVRHLLGTVETTPNPMQGRYHVFMGSPGAGKTSALVKFASHLVMKERHTIAIISLDTFKVGAADQLRIFAQILNVPFAIVRSPQEWRVAEEKLRKVQHILVDCPGFSLKTMEEADWLKSMLPPPEFNRTLHYVQSATARDEEAIDLAGRYQMIGTHDVIFTRLDETSRTGLLINLQQTFGMPIHSFGTGTRIPEDFELASKERVVDFIFKLSRRNMRED